MVTLLFLPQFPRSLKPPRIPLFLRKRSGKKNLRDIFGHGVIREISGETQNVRVVIVPGLKSVVRATSEAQARTFVNLFAAISIPNP